MKFNQLDGLARIYLHSKTQSPVLYLGKWQGLEQALSELAAETGGLTNFRKALAVHSILSNPDRYDPEEADPLLNPLGLSAVTLAESLPADRKKKLPAVIHEMKVAFVRHVLIGHQPEGLNGFCAYDILDPDETDGSVEFDFKVGIAFHKVSRAMDPQNWKFCSMQADANLFEESQAVQDDHPNNPLPNPPQAGTRADPYTLRERFKYDQAVIENLLTIDPSASASGIFRYTYKLKEFVSGPEPILVDEGEVTVENLADHIRVSGSKRIQFDPNDVDAVTLNAFSGLTLEALLSSQTVAQMCACVRFI